MNAGLFVDGLLGDERRKTGWMRAEAAGDPGPWRQQAVLGRDRWDADALRDLVRDYVTEHLADENAVLVIDETGFLKQGKASCGVARQYTGSAGKITNCQIGVFAAYVSRHGHAFIDRALANGDLAYFTTWCPPGRSIKILVSVPTPGVDEGFRDDGAPQRRPAGAYIVIGSFSTTGLWMLSPSATYLACPAASGGPVDRPRRVVRPLLLHYHGSADLDAIIEVDHVLIGQADAARRHRRAD